MPGPEARAELAAGANLWGLFPWVGIQVSNKVLVGPSGEGFVGGDRDSFAFFALGQDLEEAQSSRGAGLSVLGPSMRIMTRYVDEDLHGAEFRECDLTGARLIGVAMQDAVSE